MLLKIIKFLLSCYSINLFFSWIILEHHIHYFDEIKPDPRQVRQEKLHKRLQFYHMKQEMVDLVLSREVGVWEAILCMNAG